MAIVRYEPVDVFRRLSDQLDSLMSGTALTSDEDSSVVTSAWRPAVDIKEEPGHFLIIADVPGVDPARIEVTMEGGVLTIRGERAEDRQEEREGYRRIERSRGTFYRRFSLPDTADADKISATTTHGVLEIRIPKREVEKPRRIKVKS